MVVVHLLEIELGVVFGYLKQFPVEILPELWSDYSVAVFGRKHDVVIAQIDAVIVVSVVACGHSLSVS